MFVAALFTIAEVNSNVCIYIYACVYNIYMQYYSDLDKKEILLFATQMNLEGIMIIEINQTEERQILHGITHM